VSPGNPAFNITADGCTGATLAQGQQCSITVAFTPTSETSYNDSLTINSNTSPLTVNLTGTGQVQQTCVYSISGSVLYYGRPYYGAVTVTLSGGASQTTKTSGGAYSFTGLCNGTYTVTPSLSTLKFTPPNITVTISGADMPGQNFNMSY